MYRQSATLLILFMSMVSEIAIVAHLTPTEKRLFFRHYPCITLRKLYKTLNRSARLIQLSQVLPIFYDEMEILLS